MIRWNEEYDNFLIQNVQGTYLADLTAKFNKQFNENATIMAIKRRKTRLGIQSKTSGFKKGHIAHNWKPVGTERIRKGRILVKVAEPNVWKEKSRIIYEQHYKVEVPKGYHVIFLDNNTLNLNPSNLKMVSKNELLLMNNYKLRYNNKELTEVGHLIAKIIDKRNKLKNERL